MGTIKASDMFIPIQGSDGKTYLEDSYTHHGFENEDDAVNWLKELDKLEQYKAQVKQLRDALEKAKNIVELAYKEKSIEVSVDTYNLIIQALKDTE